MSKNNKSFGEISVRSFIFLSNQGLTDNILAIEPRLLPGKKFSNDIFPKFLSESQGTKNGYVSKRTSTVSLHL